MTKTTPIGWTLVFSAWLIATVSTLGALFLGEVMGYTPCILCWYQRIAMFPLVMVLAVGLFPFDPRVVRYALPLTLAGLGLALFHLALTAELIPESLKPCQQGVPCSNTPVVWFGFVTIPLLSVFSFLFIAHSTRFGHRFQQHPATDSTAFGRVSRSEATQVRR